MSELLKVSYGLEAYPLRIGDISIPCFILNDSKAVLLIGGIQKALGYQGRSEKWLLYLLHHINKFISIDELLQQVENPVQFQLIPRERPILKAEGLYSKTFLDVCNTIVIAKKQGYLNIHQLNYSKSAEIMLNDLSQSNIDVLIDESTGFKFFRERSIDQLQQFLWDIFEDDAILWMKTIPPSFFSTLFEVHGFDWQDLANNTQNIAKIIYEIVFSRIPDPLLTTLRQERPRRIYKKKNNKPEHMSHPELTIYILNVLSLIKVAKQNRNIFMRLLNKSYPKNATFAAAFPLRKNPSKDETLSSFNQILIKMS